MKPDAPTEVNLRDVVATGQATPSQSILTPSTIGRDDILSQVTREQSSLNLSDSSSLDSDKSKGHTRGPLFAPQSTTSSAGRPNFKGLVSIVSMPIFVIQATYESFRRDLHSPHFFTEIRSEMFNFRLSTSCNIFDFLLQILKFKHLISIEKRNSALKMHVQI